MSDTLSNVSPPDSKTMYKRLPGRGLRLSAMLVGGDRQSLYLGSDHVLALRRSGYDETSKRFYLNDIQAITVQTNGLRVLFGFILGGVLAFVGLLVGAGLTLPSDEEVGLAMLSAIIIGLPVATLFLLNLALGPTCYTYLHTAVQVEPLTALSRVRSARKCMAILLPRIHEAQGALTQESLEALAAPASPFRASANALEPRPSAPVKPLRPGLPRLTYLVMMVYALSVALDLVFVHPAKNLLDLVLFGTLMTFLLVIVVRQTGSTLPAASRRTNWVALLYNSVAFMIMMYAYSIAVAFQAQKDPSSVILFGMSNPGTMPQWYVYLSAGLMVVNAFIALFGLAALRGYTVVTRTEDEDADDST